MKAIRNILALPPMENEIERQTTQVLQVILIFFGFISLAYSILSTITDFQNWGRYVGQGGFLFLCMLLGLVYMHKGYIRPVATLEILVIWLVFTASAYTGGGVRSSGYIGYLVVLVIAGVVSTKRLNTLLVALLCAGAGYYLVYAETRGILPPSRVPMTPFALWLDSLLYFFIISGLLLLTMNIVQNALQRLNRELSERQHADARLRGIFENSPDLILEIDRTGTILLANRHAEIYEGKQAYQLVPPEDYKLVEETIARAFETGKNTTLELQAQAYDGSFQWNSIRVGPVLAGGKVTSLAAVITNVHRQKEAVLQVRRSAEKLVILNEIARAVAELTDLKTVLEIIRRQLEKLVEFDAYSVRVFNERERTVTHLAVYESGRYWDEADTPLIPGTHACKVFETGESILHLLTDEELESYKRGPYPQIGDRSHITASLIFVPLKKHGKTIGALSVQRHERNSYTREHLELVEAVAIQVAIAIENARLFESLQHELRERIRTEAVREKLIGELEQKNAELERFTYTVSHDLKSPLVTIKGFLGMLKKDMEQDRQDKVQKDMDRIAEAADKMGILLSELLELSRIGRITNPPEEVDLGQLTREALETLDGRIRARNITVTVSPHIPTVYTDRNRMREVLENLIDNAAKYMGDQPNPLIEIGKEESETETIIYVRDNGIGIEPRFRAKIFGLFEKLSADSEGSGVGLAIVKRIIETYGGRIWVESDGPGKGSTFRFTLPNEQSVPGQAYELKN
ncbi:two-component system, OmpR family, sensor histidine kinase KdpD [Anaerolineales bacterium]|nr:two-component system, OmpR family, sensor histidine kinase KdpD [Anaerolineales bacterium]